MEQKDALTIITVPKTYLVVGDPLKAGPFVGFRPIIYSPAGDPGIHGGRVVGYVVDEYSHDKAYGILCDACETYNDQKNGE